MTTQIEHKKITKLQADPQNANVGNEYTEILVNEMLTYVPITRRSIKLNLIFRGELKPCLMKIAKREV